MLQTETPTYQINGWLQRLRAGDESAREQLIACAYERLMHLAHKMLGRYENVHRWEQTDDVMQNTAMRLHRILDHARPDRAVDFFRLAAVCIRSELLDLARHYYGPLGEGANHATQRKLSGHDGSLAPIDKAQTTEDPDELLSWVEFHQQVEALPEEERDVFSLLWYQGLTQAEAAEALETSERTIKRRWQSARLKLYDALHGELPSVD
jgi:RNA polymerase sigma-70 factor (ECF subfamily)